VKVLLGYEDDEGDVIMAEEVLDVDLSTLTGPVKVYASLGDLYDGPDESGNIVSDTIASASYTLSDDTLATIESQDGVGNAVFDLTLADGTETVNVSFSTASGATGTGVGQIVISAAEAGGGGGTTGTAVSVHIDLSLTPPAAPAST
jgi:hypothetical protein